MENSEEDEEDEEDNEDELKGAMIQGEEVALSLRSKKSIEVEDSADEVSRLSARAAVNKEVPPKKLNRLSSAKVSVT